MAYDVHSRFQPVPQALLSPAHDWITKTINGPFIDTNTDIEFREYGRLYLSVDTVREMAEQAGLFDEYQKAVTKLTSQIEDMHNQSDEEYKRGIKDGRESAVVNFVRDAIANAVADDRSSRSDNPEGSGK